MGNKFTSYENVCKRLEELEKTCAELKRENAELRSRNNFGHSRCLLTDITNTDKARAIFGVAPKDGKLVKDEKAIKSNFSVFYQNVFRALAPKVYEYKGNYSLKMRNIGDLTDEEYKIYIETLDAVVDTIYYAKQQLMKGEKS